MARVIGSLAASILAVGLAVPVAAHDDLVEQDLDDTPAGQVPLFGGDGESQFSENMELVANWNDDGDYRQGSDLAFWGDLAVLGNYANPGGFRLVDVSDPADPRLVGQLACPGPQNDVSIFRDLVFLSVDSPRTGPECGAGGAPAAQVAAGEGWEGIRVVSIEDPANPRQVAAVDTDCGSHTHALVPDLPNHRLLIYVQSYPLGGQGVECNAATHRKISVVEVPLRNPAAASVVATPDVSPAIGCHDVTVLVEHELAGAACITESQLWDISDPANPEVISHIVNPAINIHHSTTFDWEGSTLVIGDELGGAAASPGCMTGGHAPLGALWFYDVSDRTAPEPVSFFQIPQTEASLFCTAHNFNTLPLLSGRDVLTTSWYNGGTTVLDFTDPAEPLQLGFAIPDDDDGRAASWSSYWYKHHIYANNFDEDVNSLTGHSRGLDVLFLDDPELHRDVVVQPHLNPQTMIRPHQVAD